MQGSVHTALRRWGRSYWDLKIADWCWTWSIYRNCRSLAVDALCQFSLWLCKPSQPRLPRVCARYTLPSESQTWSQSHCFDRLCRWWCCMRDWDSGACDSWTALWTGYWSHLPANCSKKGPNLQGTQISRVNLPRFQDWSCRFAF